MSVQTSDTGHNALKEILHRRKLQPDQHKHPVNVVHHEEATLGERLADAIASGIRSRRLPLIPPPPAFPRGIPHATGPLTPPGPLSLTPPHPRFPPPAPPTRPC